MNMTLIALILSGGILVALVGLALYLKRVVSGVRQALFLYVTPPAKDEPSEFGKTIASIADVFNEKLKQSIKGSLMGSLSAVSRNEAKLNKMVTESAIKGASPLGGVLDLLPEEWKEKAIANPSMAMAAINWLQKQVGSEAVSTPSNGGGDLSSFNLGG